MNILEIYSKSASVEVTVGVGKARGAFQLLVTCSDG